MEASCMTWFNDMVKRCHAQVTAFHAQGAPIVGILCEYTPRELILAAGGWPVCLCGGDAGMIPEAEKTLPANLCPIVKSTFGYSANQANPFLQMASLVVAETTCDGKKKMYERLAERHPMHVLELPQKPDDPDARAHWLQELRKFRAALETRFHVSVTDEKLREAIRLMNRERRLRLALARTMRADALPLSGRELLDMKSLVACLPDDLAAYARIADFLEHRPEAERPARDNVRVLLTGVPVPHGAERILDLLEGDHATVVCQENCTGLKPIQEEVDEDAADPLAAIADFYLHLPCSVMTPNALRLERLERLATDYKAECVVELVWRCCLTYDVESGFTRDLAGRLALPYLKIETDYSPNDDARLALRLGALYETVRAARKPVR